MSRLINATDTCESFTPLFAPSGDELLLTEMIFNGLFNDLTVEQATALLSCFVFQENVRPNARKHSRATQSGNLTLTMSLTHFHASRSQSRSRLPAAVAEAGRELPPTFLFFLGRVSIWDNKPNQPQAAGPSLSVLALFCCVVCLHAKI